MAELLAFHFTIVKTLRDPGTTFTPGVKAKHATMSSGRPEYMGKMHVDEPMLQMGRSGIQKYWHLALANIGSTFTEIGTIDKRLTWPLQKDGIQAHEANLIA